MKLVAAHAITRLTAQSLREREMCVGGLVRFARFGLICDLVRDVHPVAVSRMQGPHEVLRWGSVSEALEAAATLFAVPCGEEWSRIR